MRSILRYSILLLLLTVCLTGCAANCVPQSGNWICDELNLKLSFDVYGASIIEVDNKTIFLSLQNDRNSNTIILFGKHPEIGRKIQLVAFDCIDLTDSILTVRAEESSISAVQAEGKIYQFYLIKDD